MKALSPTIPLKPTPPAKFRPPPVFRPQGGSAAAEHVGKSAPGGGPLFRPPPSVQLLQAKSAPVLVLGPNGRRGAAPSLPPAFNAVPPSGPAVLGAVRAPLAPPPFRAATGWHGGPGPSQRKVLPLIPAPAKPAQRQLIEVVGRGKDGRARDSAAPFKHGLGATIQAASSASTPPKFSYLAVANDGTVSAKKGTRPNNQSSASTQVKVWARLSNTKLQLPDHMVEFGDQVERDGKASLSELGLDICHTTSSDTMKGTLIALLNGRRKATKSQIDALAAAIENTISSDEDADRHTFVKLLRKVADPATAIEAAVHGTESILRRTNRASRNLRPDHKSPNRGVGKSNDPFLIEISGEFYEEARSKGIAEYWDKARQALKLKAEGPKIKKFRKKRLVKSSSVHAVSAKSFAEVNPATVTL